MTRHIAAMAVAATALLAPSTALAQAASPEALQSALVRMFETTDGVALVNVRGFTGDPDHWTMRREATGAVNVNRCFLDIRTRTLSHSSNVTPANHYALDWSTVTQVQWDGDRTVSWWASHMAANEQGRLVLPDRDLAEMVWVVFDYMKDAC